MKSKAIHLSVLLSAALGFLGTAQAEKPTFVDEAIDADKSTECQTLDLGPVLQPVEGRAQLCVHSWGLRGNLDARNLVPDEAYTVWWVYIDDPASCAVAPGICTPADFFGDNPLGVFGRMDSGIAPASGRVFFNDALRDMEPSPGSQVWLLLFTHGPADRDDGRRLSRQLLTPEDPVFGAPHLGNFVDGTLGFPAGLAVFEIQ